MSATKTYPFLLCALAVLAARDSVRAYAVTLDFERQAIVKVKKGQISIGYEVRFCACGSGLQVVAGVHPLCPWSIDWPVYWGFLWRCGLVDDAFVLRGAT